MLSEADRKYLELLKKSITENCPVCKGSGQDCDCQKQFLLEINKAQSHIPIKYRQFTLDDIDVLESKSAKEKVISYMNDLTTRKLKGDGLFLWSENKGTGKTALGNIVLIEALKQGFTTYFTDLDECVTLTTSGWFDELKKREFAHQILETDFLLIDDVGGMEVRTKGNSDLIETTFISLFKKRCNNLLPTIMTSNLRPEDLQEDYGERLFSIACEHLITVECKGADFRQTVIAPKKKLG